LLNLKEIYSFSQKVQLQFEEIVFLYSIHDRLECPDDEEFKAMFSWYHTRFQFYNRNGGNSHPIYWLDMINKLVKEGYIDDLRTEEEKSLDTVLLSKFSVTEKFTSLLNVSNDKEYWWEFYFDIWKSNASTVGSDNIPVVIGTSIYILKPDTGNPKMNSIEKIKDIFWDEFCLRGQKAAINTFFGNTEKYLTEHGANMKICNFFSCYKEMFKPKK
jgi:hypothetical protein